MSILAAPLLAAPSPDLSAESTALLNRIRTGIVGEGTVLDGPYGPRRMTYADYTASGRALGMIEDAIRHLILPVYANTHTESSATGLATGRLREDAREMIHRAVGAGDTHVVIFCGSGSTGAISKLISILELHLPDGLDRRFGLAERIPAHERPVVFVGPYEHHSNELLWRESVADVVPIPADRDGQIDVTVLRAALVAYADRPLRIGSFSAASNVTGMISDTDRIASLLHDHGALSFWDYAAAGPYLPIRMVASAPGRNDHKDAVFVSPHKLVGGPQTPGVLVVARDLVRNRVPTVPGGGTITFVSPSGQYYADDPAVREEGGTPAIVESIRAGLAFALKEAVGTELIQAREEHFWRRALRHWSVNPNLEILGGTGRRRLPIVSFRVRHAGRLLHHNFVVALLSDLFGIQARGGCSCAGPYGHYLMDIGPDESYRIRDEVQRGRLGIKPGWARLGFNYFFSDATADFLIGAVDLIAAYGHRLLGDYRFDAASGLWRHHTGLPRPPLRLGDLRFTTDGSLVTPAPPRRLGEDVFAEYLDRARVLMSVGAAGVDGAAGVAGVDGAAGVDGRPVDLPAEFEALRHFHLPPICLSGFPAP